MKERVWDFQEVGRLPAPGDNVAMATRRLQAGTRVSYGGSEFTVGHTVLEGHRFAVEPIAEGEDLLSWGLRFGRAMKDIAPGDYACNEKIIRVLRERLRVSPERGEDEDPEGTSDQGGGLVQGRQDSPTFQAVSSATPNSSPTYSTRSNSAPASRFPSTTNHAPSWATGVVRAGASGRVTT